MDFEGKRKLAIQRLAEEIVNGRLCVFLGAGCSVEAGLPSWGGLIDKLKDKFEIKTAESDFLRVAARIEKKAGKAAARQAVVDILKTRPNLKTEIHRAIAILPVNLYATTNYDHLLEDAIRQTGNDPVVVRDPKDISFIDPKTKNVVKLHGDIDSPSSMVFTKMDYTLYAKEKAPFVEWLNSILLNHVVVFLGTSFDDPRLGEADDHILNLLGNFRLNPLIFFKPPEQEKCLSIDDFKMKMEDFQARCDEFEERGFVVIPLSSWKELPGILSDVGNNSQQILRRKNPEEDRNISIIQSGRIGDLEEQVAGLLDEKTKRLCENLRPRGKLLPYKARMEKAAQLRLYLQEKSGDLKPASLIEGYLALADAYAVPEGPEDIARARSFYRKAEAFFGKVKDKDPWANRLLRCHAKLLFMEGDEEEAIKTIADSEDPKSISLWLAILLDSKRFEPAKDFVEKQKALHPSWACQAIATLVVTGSVEKAEKNFESIFTDYKKQQNGGALKDAGYGNEHYPIILFFLTARALLERALKVSGVVKPIRLVSAKLNEEGKALCSKSLGYIERLYDLTPPSIAKSDETMAMAVHLDMEVSTLLLIYSRADEAAINLINVRPVRKDVANFIVSRADYHKKEHLEILQKNLVQDHETSAWAWQQAGFIQAVYLGMVEEAWKSISTASENVTKKEEKDSIAQLAFDIGEISQDRTRADLIIEGLLEKDAPILSYFNAERLLKDGDPVQAEKILLALLKEDIEEPFRSIVFLALSRSAEKQNKWKKALEYIDAPSSQLDPIHRLGGDQDYFLRRLHLYTKIQDNTAILNTVRQIESMGLENENVFYVKAQAAHNLQKFDIEEHTYQRLYEQFGCKPLYAKQRAEALFWMGRAEEALGVLAPHIHNNDSLDLDCLGLAAKIESTSEDFDKAFSLLEACWEKIQDTPVLLLHMLDLGYRTGNEDRAHVAMMRLQALESEGRLPKGMLVQVGLSDLKKHILQRRESEKALQEYYLKGSLPRLAMCQFSNRPLYLDWAIRTQELALGRDPGNWIDFITYSTNGLRVKIKGGSSQLLPIEVPKDVDEIVIDYSALITLHQLGLLKKVQKSFDKIYYPQILDGVWANDQRHFTHHQKSKAETYNKLKMLLDHGEIKYIAAPGPQEKGKASKDTYVQRNLRLARLEKAPYLDAFAKEKDLKGFEQVPVLRLSQVAEWLFSRGKIGEKQFQSILQKHKKGEAGPLEDETARILEDSQRLIADEITLELLEQEGFIPLMLDIGTRIVVEKATAFSINNAAESIGFLKIIGEKHRELAQFAKESPVFTHVSVELDENWDGDMYWQAAVAPFWYADNNRLVLLTDDRTLQMLPGKDGENRFFGTDALLLELYKRGAITLEKYALDFHQLCKWRYRFLIPNVEILYFFANQYRKRPLGQPLNDFADYSRQCLRDPGMFWGPEKTEPPLPLGFKFQMAWQDVWMELLIRLWSEGEWIENALENFTRKVFRQALPGYSENIAPELRQNMARVDEKRFILKLFVATPAVEKPTRLNGLYELTFEYLGFDEDQRVRSLRDYVESALSIPEIGNDLGVFRGTILFPLLEAFYGTSKTFPKDALLEEIYEKVNIPPKNAGLKGEPLSPEQNRLLEKIRDSQMNLEDVEGPLIVIPEPVESENLVLAPHEMIADGLLPFRQQALDYLIRQDKVSNKTKEWLRSKYREILNAQPSKWRPAAKETADAVLRDFKYSRGLFVQAMGMSPPKNEWIQAAWSNAVARPDWDSAWDEAPFLIKSFSHKNNLQKLLQRGLRKILSEQTKTDDEKTSDSAERDPITKALNWYWKETGFLPFAPPLDPWNVIAPVLKLEPSARESKEVIGKTNYREILQKSLSWAEAEKGKRGRDPVAWVLALNVVLNARDKTKDQDKTVLSSGKDFIRFMNLCFTILFEPEKELETDQESMDIRIGQVLFEICRELAAHYMRSMDVDQWDGASAEQRSLLAWWMAREMTIMLDQASSMMEKQDQIKWLENTDKGAIFEITRPNIIRHVLAKSPKPLSVEYFMTTHGRSTLPAGAALAMIRPGEDGRNPCFRAMVEPERALTKPGREGIFPVMLKQSAWGLGQVPTGDPAKANVLWVYPTTVTGPEFLLAYYEDNIEYLGDEKNGLIKFCQATSTPDFLDEAFEQLPETLEKHQDYLIALTFSSLKTYVLTRGRLPKSAKILADPKLPEKMNGQNDHVRQTVISSLLEILIQLRTWGEKEWIEPIESFLAETDVMQCKSFADSFVMEMGIATLQGTQIALWDAVVNAGKTDKAFRRAMGQLKTFLNSVFPYLPASAMDRARVILTSMEDIPEPDDQ